jgi:hypothetical protein
MLNKARDDVKKSAKIPSRRFRRRGLDYVVEVCLLNHAERTKAVPL